MKKLLITALFAIMSSLSFSMETSFVKIDFDKMTVVFDGKTYELVELKQKQGRTWREITYLCIDSESRAVAFKLLVADNGDFLRFQKFLLKK